MSDDGNWQDLDSKQVAALSEGFCAWTDGCKPDAAEVLRDGEKHKYLYCPLMDTFARIKGGQPEVLPMEVATKNGWSVKAWEM